MHQRTKPIYNSGEMDSPGECEAHMVAKLNALPSGTTAELRELRREFSRRLSKTSDSMVFEVALRLIERQLFSCRFIAYELVQHHQQARRSLNAMKLKQLGKGLDSWAAVDTFACYLAGPAWRAGQVTDKLIHCWARSKDRWWRRAALVSTVPLNNKARGGTGDTRRTLQVCELLIADRDDMVVKALSWSLRELAKRDPAAAKEFLSKHEDVLSSRVIREVGNKLCTGLKNPRKRGPANCSV